MTPNARFEDEKNVMFVEIGNALFTNSHYYKM